MKNHYLFKQTKIILLFVLFLSGFTVFSQSNKRVVTSKTTKIETTTVVPTDPTKEVVGLKRETPEVPFNYTATKVSLSANASPEAKAEFFKKHNADHYYIYSDDKAKIVSKEEMEIALQLEKSKSINKTPITNPKK